MNEKKILTRWKELPHLYKIQLVSYLIAGICGAIAYPLTTKMIYSSVDVDVLAERLVLSSVIGLVLSWMWLTIQERLYRWFVGFTLIEFVLYVGLILYVILCENYNGYLIGSTVIASTIGHIVSGGGQKLHQKITNNEQHRTDYGFFIEIISSFGILVGSGMAVTVNFSLTVAFLLLLMSVMFFQMMDIYVYHKVKERDETNRENMQPRSD